MIKRILLFFLLAALLLGGVNLWVYDAFDVDQYPLVPQIKFDDYIRTDYRDRI